ncbi:MAG TPA: hypothetical protein VGE90_07365 [Chitinophaga sp.]
MKSTFYTLLTVVPILLSLSAAAQQLKLGNNPGTINKSAVLELESSKQGLLLTRITDTTVAPLTTAPDGMLLFFKGDNSLRIRSGNAWKKALTSIDSTDIANFSQKVRGLLSAGSGLTFNSATGVISMAATGTGSAWALGGNGVTATQNLGTTTNYDLPFITNNTERMRISTSGNVGIGSSSFNNTNPEKLLIDAGSSSSNTAVNVKGSVNSVFQFNIQNNHGGQSASTNIVATANNGNGSSNYINMGINSGGYSQATILGSTNAAYLYGTGPDLVIGTASNTRNLIFCNGGTAYSNAAMRIDASGDVGIANSSPQAKLDVGGNFKLGASGTVMTSVIKTSVSFTDNTNIGYTTPLTKVLAVSGAAANASVIVNPRAALPAGVGIAYSFVSSAGNITINFTNTGAGTLGLQKLGAITLDITIINI